MNELTKGSKFTYIDSNNKQWTAKGKIVHVSSDMIYVYTQTKDGGFVQKMGIFIRRDIQENTVWVVRDLLQRRS